MSIRKIRRVVYECTCELADCTGIDPKTGKHIPWISNDDQIPKRCRWCLRYTWNGVDKRRKKPAKKGKAKS